MRHAIEAGNPVDRLTPVRSLLLVAELIAVVCGVIALLSLGNRGSSDTADAAQTRAVICQNTLDGNGTTVEIDQSAVQVYLDAGGYLGPCASDLAARAITAAEATPEPTATGT